MDGYYFVPFIMSLGSIVGVILNNSCKTYNTLYIPPKKPNLYWLLLIVIGVKYGVEDQIGVDGTKGSLV